MTISDQLVDARLIEDTHIRLQNRGFTRAIEELESAEPDLAEYFLESWASLYHQLLNLGITPRRARRFLARIQTLNLVSIASLQTAHRRLWQEDFGSEITRQLDKQTMNPKPNTTSPKAYPPQTSPFQNQDPLLENE